MPVDLNGTNIDHKLPKYHKLLENLQANILKSHGRDESNHLLIQFTGNSGRVRNWIRHFSGEFVTSARKQLDDTEEFKLHGNPGGLIGSFYLSAKGYEFLRLEINDFEDSDSGGSFRNGMKHRQFNLLFPNRDPRPPEWEEPYQGDIHAMVVLADGSDTNLQEKTGEVLGELREIAQVLAIEHGKVLRNEKGESIEHFGYVDGRSNPVFLKQDIDEEINGCIDKWDPSAPLKLVLIDDPFSDEEDSYGSYLVFRKLEQDVVGFNEDVRKLSRKLGTNEALAGAFAVGRFKDGTPVTMQDNDGLGAVNNFEYLKDDRSGGRCPFHAHVRKANQRGANPSMSDEEERDRRIVRRGVPYGDPLVQPENMPSSKRGLLFVCFQSNISRQFEFIQRVWADNPNFPEFLLIPGLNTGDDSVIGQHPRALQKWPREWGLQRRIIGRLRFNFGGHVTLRGGEYFFAPSLSFLKNVV